MSGGSIFTEPVDHAVFEFAFAPGVTDDSDSAFRVGDVWIDTSTSPRESYRALDVSVGAAVWVITSNADELAAHEADLANPHATDIENLGSGTLAELNAAVTDATLVDSVAAPFIVDLTGDGKVVVEQIGGGATKRVEISHDGTVLQMDEKNGVGYTWKIAGFSELLLRTGALRPAFPGGLDLGSGTTQFKQSFFNDRMFINLASDVVGLLIKGNAAQTLNLVEVQDSASAILSRFNKAGFFMTRKVTEPADGDLVNSEIALRMVNTPGSGALAVKGKESDGTVFTAIFDDISASRPPNGPAGGDLTGTYPDPTIPLNLISNTKAADMPANTIKGNDDGGAADPKDLTTTETRILLNVEDGATADQTDAEIETAYNNQVAIVPQAEAEAGTATTRRGWTAERVKQAIEALGGDNQEDVFTWVLNGGVSSGAFQDGYRAARKSGTITGVIVTGGQRGNTGTALYDINKHVPTKPVTTQRNATSGVTIYTTQANRPDHDGLSANSGDNFIKQAVAPDVTTFLAGDFFSLDVDASMSQVQNVVVQMTIKYNAA